MDEVVLDIKLCILGTLDWTNKANPESDAILDYRKKNCPHKLNIDKRKNQ